MSSRPGPPTQLQLAVEDEEAHQAEPEDRHRVADQADEPHEPGRRGCPGRVAASTPAGMPKSDADAAWRWSRARASPGRPGRRRRSPAGRSAATCRSRRWRRRGRRSRTAPRSGRLRPSASRAASYCSAVARSPMMASTGSIGITRPMTKVTASSPSSVAASVSDEARRARRAAPAARSEVARPGDVLLVRHRRAGGRRRRPPCRYFVVFPEGGRADRAAGREALDVRAQRHLLDLLEHRREGRDLLVDALDLLVHLRPLVAVLLEHRGVGQVVGLGRRPGVAPGEDAGVACPRRCCRGCGRRCRRWCAGRDSPAPRPP